MMNKKRHNVKPGITGWAQVNGRNAIGWDQKFKLDVWYAENQSFKLDMYIIYKTIINILQRKDINALTMSQLRNSKGMKYDSTYCFNRKGGHSKVIKDIIEEDKQYYVAGYLDHAINEYYMDKEVFYDNLDNIEV